MTDGDIEVRVGSILFEYTGGSEVVSASGATLAELFVDLDRRFPGLGFRVVDEQGRLRPHVAVFVDQRVTRDLATNLEGAGTVHILGALSGG